MRGSQFVIGIVAAGVLLTGCSAAPSAPSSGGGATPATPAAIVAERCTVCHPVDRIKAASHDAAAWKVTVDRMRGKGARLSDTEEQQVIDFLAGGGGAKL